MQSRTSRKRKIIKSGQQTIALLRWEFYSTRNVAFSAHETAARQSHEQKGARIWKINSIATREKRTTTITVTDIQKHDFHRITDRMPYERHYGPKTVRASRKKNQKHVQCKWKAASSSNDRPIILSLLLLMLYFYVFDAGVRSLAHSMNSNGTVFIHLLSLARRGIGPIYMLIT